MLHIEVGMRCPMMLYPIVGDNTDVCTIVRQHHSQGLTFDAYRRRTSASAGEGLHNDLEA